MKALIIQNNLPDAILNKGEHIYIPLDNSQTLIDVNYSFEILLLENLSEVLSGAEYEGVVVSLNLNSNNCLNLNGLDVAYTLRLSPELNHQFIAIVILGSLSLEIVLRLNPKANILLTPGMYYQVLSEAADAVIDNRKFKKISKEEHNEFLNRIEINPPSNYQSHHSIVNEWCILRWAEALKISENPALNFLRQKTEGLLFF